MPIDRLAKLRKQSDAALSTFRVAKTELESANASIDVECARIARQIDDLSDRHLSAVALRADNEVAIAKIAEFLPA